MTHQEAIDVLTDLRNDALRRRDDRANQFSEVHYNHMSPVMKRYYQSAHDDAVTKVEAYELAIEALKEGMCVVKETPTARPPP